LIDTAFLSHMPSPQRRLITAFEALGKYRDSAQRAAKADWNEFQEKAIEKYVL